MAIRLVITQVGLITRVGARADLQKEVTHHPPLPDPHYPREFQADHCLGHDHLTFVIVDQWKNTIGVHDPFSLYQAVLKRLNSTDSEVTQSGLSLNVATYSISLTGEGLITFHGDGAYEWATGSTAAAEMLNNQTTTVTFKGAAPTGISIRLLNDSDQVSAISLTDSTGAEHIKNHDFTQKIDHFYDIESWLVAATDVKMVPKDVLGYLEGYNSHMLYTVFE